MWGIWRAWSEACGGVAACLKSAWCCTAFQVHSPRVLSMRAKSKSAVVCFCVHKLMHIGVTFLDYRPEMSQCTSQDLGHEVRTPMLDGYPHGPDEAHCTPGLDPGFRKWEGVLISICPLLCLWDASFSSLVISNFQLHHWTKKKKHAATFSYTMYVENGSFERGEHPPPPPTYFRDQGGYSNSYDTRVFT